MSTSTWTGAVNNDWADADNWSPADIPGVNSDVVIAAGAPVAVASASIGTVNSITDSSDLYFESAGTNTVTTFLDDTGHLKVDAKGGEGGTILNIGGTLTNSNHLVIGNATLSASDEVTAAALDNTGKIYLTGSSADQALLDVTGAAGFGTAGVMSGYARLAGDSAIEFASGEITSLAHGAQLHLSGSDAFIEDSTALGSNSALAGLASIGAGAIFGLHNEAAVSTTGSLANDGDIRLDFAAGDGGSSLTVGGTLTNSGTLDIGNTTLSASDEVTAASLDNTGKIQLISSSGANQALLDVTGAAGFGTAGVLSGNVTLGQSGAYDVPTLGGNDAIEFVSGEIANLAANAKLRINGGDAFIEDSTALGSNSALAGLASIGANASFDLENGASVSTTGALANDGAVVLDTDYGDGGSSLTVGGTLTNSYTLQIGNTALSASDEVTAASLDNTGSIDLTGISFAGPSASQTLLDVTGGAGFGAAGVLSGNVDLSGDSAIEFASGEITSLAANAQLTLGGVYTGNEAFIEDSTALGSNSALTGLASIGAGATLTLSEDTVSTSGGLSNDGTIDVNFGGLLDVTAGSAGFGAAGTLTGTVEVYDGAIEFASGQISTIATGASLSLSGGAFIEDSTALASNSALTGLADIEGSLSIGGGASVSTAGALVNNGSLSASGSSSATLLNVAGTLTNTGSLSISAVSVAAQSFVNSGTVSMNGFSYTGVLNVSGALTNNGAISISYAGVLNVSGALTNNGAISMSTNSDLSVSGTLTNNGSISIAGDTEELAGAVAGTGSFSLSNTDLQFDSSVSAGQTIDENGAALTLEQAQSFAATISGFGTADTIDATNFAETGTTYHFVENMAGTGGTLTLTDTSLSLTAHILMTGDYSNSSFALAHDSGTGTLVKFA